MTDQDQKPKLILPTTKGVPNLEVRRMMRELEAKKEPLKIHPQTAKEISLHLDCLQKLTQESKIRGMMLCALLVEGTDHGGKALTLFGVPNQDKSIAEELLTYTRDWVIQCAVEMGITDDPPEAG